MARTHRHAPITDQSSSERLSAEQAVVVAARPRCRHRTHGGRQQFVEGAPLHAGQIRVLLAVAHYVARLDDGRGVDLELHFDGGLVDLRIIDLEHGDLGLDVRERRQILDLCGNRPVSRVRTAVPAMPTRAPQV